MQYEKEKTFGPFAYRVGPMYFWRYLSAGKWELGWRFMDESAEVNLIHNIWRGGEASFSVVYPHRLVSALKWADGWLETRRIKRDPETMAAIREAEDEIIPVTIIDTKSTPGPEWEWPEGI